MLLNLLRFPTDDWWILVVRHLVTVVRKASQTAAPSSQASAATVPDKPNSLEVRIFDYSSGNTRFWRFVQEVSCLGAENLRCGAFAVSVPFVCCLRSGLWFETLRLRFACERSGRTPKVSCSFNGKEALIVNCHLVSSGGGGGEQRKLKPYMLDGRECVLRLTQDIKEAVVRQLAGRYGGGASKPITIIGGGTSTSSTRMRRSSGPCLAAALVSALLFVCLGVCVLHVLRPCCDPAANQL